MSGKYPDRIKALPLYDGRFDAYKLEARDSDVLFASYPAGTTIPPHVHDTDMGRTTARQCTPWL
jgi:hypothetical protein